jgi:hypothetical protein
MPQLKPGEAAVTESNFSCRTNTSVVVLRQTSDSAGSYSATVKVEKMTVTLGLEIVIWLPEGGQRKLGEHEQGHQRISEHFYATGKEITTALAQAEIGREYSASASSAEEAVDTAIREAGNAVCEQYMSRVQMRAANVQELYDKLTDHGRNRLDEDTAIERATAADAREQRASASPSTAPARGS